MKLKKADRVLADLFGKTIEGDDFQTVAEFSLVRPKDTTHYGTGCYMSVKTHDIIKGNENNNSYHVDVRYEKTTDIQILAERWLEGYYGNNLERCTISVVYDVSDDE